MGGRTPLPLAHSSQILPGMKVRMKSGHWDGQSDLKVTVKGTREISKTVSTGSLNHIHRNQISVPCTSTLS